jgi:hypothetical protein
VLARSFVGGENAELGIKNALDSTFGEGRRRPVAFVSLIIGVKKT